MTLPRFFPLFKWAHLMRTLHIVSSFLFYKNAPISFVTMLFYTEDICTYREYFIRMDSRWNGRVCVFVHALSIRVYKINRIIVRHIYFWCNIRPFARKWYQTTTPTDEIKRSPRMHKNHKGRLIRVWPVNCALLVTSTASSVENSPVCTNKQTSAHHIHTHILHRTKEEAEAAADMFACKR